VLFFIFISFLCSCRYTGYVLLDSLYQDGNTNSVVPTTCRLRIVFVFAAIPPESAICPFPSVCVHLNVVLFYVCGTVFHYFCYLREIGLKYQLICFHSSHYEGCL
jgi:hypothetical protein